MTNQIKMPKKITKTLYVTMGIGRWNHGNINITDYEPSDDDVEFAKALLTTTEITIALPKDIKLNAKSKFVAILEKKKSGIQAKYHMELKEVQDQIDNLLAIEYKSEETQ